MNGLTYLVHRLSYVLPVPWACLVLAITSLLVRSGELVRLRWRLLRSFGPLLMCYPALPAIQPVLYDAVAWLVLR